MPAMDEDRIAAPVDAALVRRLLGYARPHARAFAAALALAAATAGCEVALPWLSQIAIDRGLVAGARSVLPVVAMAAVGVLVARYLAGAAASWLSQAASQRVLATIRARVGERLVRAEQPWLDRQPIGRLVTRATGDITAIGEFYASLLLTAVRDVCLMVGAIAMLAWMDVRLCLLACAALPVLAWVSWEFRARARDAFRATRARVAATMAWLAEHLGGMRALRLFGREAQSRAAFAAVGAEEHRAQMRQLGLFAVFQPLIALLATTAMALLLWRGGLDVVGGGLELGDLQAFLLLLDLMLAPARDLAERYQQLQGAMAAAERVTGVLDQPAEPRGALAPAALAGELAFADVWFAYRGGAAPADADWVLRGVSFTAPPGTRLALVGPTGAGKTTIAALALGFLVPQRGRVLIDGRDLRDYDLGWLRARMAAVFQETFLFAGTVAENVSLREDLPRERLEAAASAAQAADAIAGLPGGWDARLAGDAALSSGERQLLAFARALARDPRILVLDEATAHVDAATESRIRAAEAALLAGRTSLIIAHRLATIRSADRILVLEGGMVREAGAHAELMAAGGLYRQLHDRQAALDELASLHGGPRPVRAGP